MPTKNIPLKLKVISFPNNKVNKDMARLNIRSLNLNSCEILYILKFMIV